MQGKQSIKTSISKIDENFGIIKLFDDLNKARDSNIAC